MKAPIIISRNDSWNPLQWRLLPLLLMLLCSLAASSQEVEPTQSNDTYFRAYEAWRFRAEVLRRQHIRQVRELETEGDSTRIEKVCRINRQGFLIEAQDYGSSGEVWEEKKWDLDSTGQVLKEWAKYSKREWEIVKTYSYDDQGRLRHAYYTGRQGTRYTYDDSSRLILKEGLDAPETETRFIYNDSGQVVIERYTRANRDAEEVTTTSYDSKGRETAVYHIEGGDTVRFLSYKYSRRGWTETYYYKDQGRQHRTRMRRKNRFGVRTQRWKLDDYWHNGRSVILNRGRSDSSGVFRHVRHRRGWLFVRIPPEQEREHFGNARNRFNRTVKRYKSGGRMKVHKLAVTPFWTFHKKRFFYNDRGVLIGGTVSDKDDGFRRWEYEIEYFDPEKID